MFSTTGKRQASLKIGFVVAIIHDTFGQSSPVD